MGHTVGLKADGTAWAWGDNMFGQLGNNSTTDSLIPVSVTTSVTLTWKTISTKNMHTVGVKSDGTLWTWGANTDGQLGDNSIIDRWTPVPIGTDKWTAVSAGIIHTMALKSDGTLWAWGDNAYGQLGDDSIDRPPHPCADRHGQMDICLRRGRAHARIEVEWHALRLGQ